MFFKKNPDSRQIFFWERIGFRISLGFVLPLAVSAYALYSLSSVFSDLNESKDRLQRIIGSVVHTENQVQINLFKIRMNLQSLMYEPSEVFLNQIQSELKELKVDVDQVKKTMAKVGENFNLTLDSTNEKSYVLIMKSYQDMYKSVDKVTDSLRAGRFDEAKANKKEFDASSLQLEQNLGKFRAQNELYELKILDVVKSREDQVGGTLSTYLLAVFFIGMIMALVVTLSITRPVRRVVDRIRDIAKGNGDLTQRVANMFGGELGELAYWLNLFLDQTSSIVQAIGDASHVVKRTTAEVSQQTNKTTMSTNNISKNMMEQSMNLDEATSFIASIHELIKNSDESTNQAASLSKVAMDRALQGGSSVFETVEAMQKIEDSSTKIEKLVSSITEIAAQTNLLAINAAVEASKAGEHGKGFAVVAEEVRRLAEKSKKLTGEVTQLISESSTRVKTGAVLARGAGASLDGIIKDVEAVASLIQRIAATATRQSESSHVVLEVMQKLAGDVRTNLASMQEVSRFTEFTAFEVTKLETLVAQLDQVLSQFRLQRRAVEEQTTGYSFSPDGATGAINRHGLAPLPAGRTEADQESKSDPTIPGLESEEGSSDAA